MPPPFRIALGVRSWTEDDGDRSSTEEPPEAPAMMALGRRSTTELDGEGGVPGAATPLSRACARV